MSWTAQIMQQHVCGSRFCIANSRGWRLPLLFPFIRTGSVYGAELLPSRINKITGCEPEDVFTYVLFELGHTFGRDYATHLRLPAVKLIALGYKSRRVETEQACGSGAHVAVYVHEHFSLQPSALFSGVQPLGLFEVRGVFLSPNPDCNLEILVVNLLGSDAIQQRFWMDGMQ